MKSKSKFYISLLLIVLVISIGIIGYTTIEKGSFIDSLYMTVITMSTVGFGEIHRLSIEGKLFTIFLIIISLIVYVYAVTSLTEYIANEKLFQNLKLKKVRKKINNLQNHTVVVGYGRNGKQALARLKEFNMPCVVIEKNKDLIQLLDEQGHLYIEGDATEDSTLEFASLKNAKSIIAALPSDADNLMVVLTARQINKDLIIISRASNESSFKKLKIAGANNIIMPDKIGGDHMASLVVTPNLIEFVDKLTIIDEDTTNLEEIAINDLPNEFIGKTILDLDVRKRTGCNVIGFKNEKQKYIINPEANTVLTANSSLIVLGRPNQIEKLHEEF
ncbi:MAG: potassium channel family protein [Lutibacter sp.]